MADLTLSLQRLSALFELFARERGPLSSTEICHALGAPRSSTAALLKGLAQMGWLAHDRRAATYLPTARFAMLGSWVLESATLSPALLEAVHQLQVASGETVSLTSPVDLGLEVLYVAGPDVGIRLVVKVGGRMPLWRTAIGTAYLTTVPDSTIRSMYRRTEARGTPPAVSLRSVLAAVRRARECHGKAYAEGAAVPDVAALSAPLPEGFAPRQLIVSIGGPVHRMRARRAAIELELDAWLARVASLAPQATSVPESVRLAMPTRARGGRRA